MKRKEFVRQLLRDGCRMVRPGSRHDVFTNPKTGQKQPVPRHTEIDNALARHIRKCLGLE
jgi:predicted RNA binding protein YcfA (HicA-like mRNA interferase family)